jgi:hypothetical protein
MNLWRIAIALILALCTTVQPVFAHSGARLEISATHLNPGGTLELRGAGFGSEEVLTVTLDGPAGRLSLPPVTADAEGGFIYLAVLPSDLAEGTYIVSASSPGRRVLSPPFLISGQPISASADEQGEQREQEEPLLAPAPDFSQSTPAANPVSPAVEHAASVRPAAPGMLIGGAALFVLLVGCIALWLRQRRQ